MFRSIFLSVMLMFSANTFAQTADIPNPCLNIPAATNGKKQDEVSAILEACRGASITVGNTVKSVTPEKAAIWTQAAKGFAEAIGIAAKELGIATNDFLDSPAGYLLAAILIVNYAGGFIIGMPVTFMSFGVLLWIYRRGKTNKIEYERVPVLWGAFTINRKKTIDYSDISDTDCVILLIGAAMMAFLNLIVWLNIG